MRLAGLLLFPFSLLSQSFTLDQILSAPFPSDLTASATGAKVAWVSNARGVRNIRVAEPPDYQPYSLTPYTEDDGQEIASLRWTPDSSAILYVRGDTANPTLNPAAPAATIWIALLHGESPRRIGEGDSPAISPKGDRVVFVRRGQLWIAPLGGAPVQLFQSRGAASAPLWSPDGARIAFTSGRGDHSFIGVWDMAAASLRYLDAGTDNDSNPEWSPDSRSIAFIRIPSSGLRPVREARRTGEPWSIRVVNVETGAGREIWRASPGPGSVFRGVTARNQLLWTAAGDIIFPWESDGWTHLYSVPATGGKAMLRTPGEFEVQDVALSAGRANLVYSSSGADDRISSSALPAAPATTNQCFPTPTSDPALVAYLESDARRPLHPVIGSRHLDAPPSDFPLSKLVVPQAVTFRTPDGLTIHAQLFLPTARPAAGHLPAVMFFHGGSRRQMLLGWHPMFYYHNAYAFNQYLAAQGYAVLSVNYRSGIGYGLNFREALHYGPSGASEYIDVKAAADYLRARADIDPARIGVWGGSYGGYLTAMALARNSDLFKAGVDFHGVHDWARELLIPAGEPDYKLAFDSSPMAFVKTWRSPVLLIAGDDDRDVQFNQTVMLADALRKQNVEIEELIFPDEIHDFLLYRTWRQAYEAAARFLSAHL